ncbi:MAG: hypothetical protein ACI9EZ_001781, partial [Halobacteriales archaeon]
VNPMLVSILILLVGIPWLCVAGWVVKDGWNTTSLSPVWALGVFLTGPPGLFLYLAFGSN